MKVRLLLLVFVLWKSSKSQINPTNITIARDSFGVPHIFANTDAEAAYGLAWAHSEDNFFDIQCQFLAAHKSLGLVLGKEGVAMDYLMQLLKVDSLVDARYDSDLSADFKKVVSGYMAGVNAYAKSHPKEVLVQKALPFSERDLIKGYTLNTSLLAGTGMALKAIREDRIEEFFAPNDRGSNSMAVAPSLTEDGKSWLLVNSHQPIEGRMAWYEAHICSNEGWNMLGGLFPGGLTIFVGTNEYLGWAHTNNYHTFGDIYKLKKKGKKYLLDGEWKGFQQRTAKLKVKLNGVKLSVSKKMLTTDFGPVMKGKDGNYYAIRFPGYTDIRAAEQWFRMNKSHNFADFEKALMMEALPLFNTVYADRQGNIFYQSGGMFPLRNDKLNWQEPLDGSKGEFKWTKLVPYESKVTLINPDCGYVFNCNQTPLLCTGSSCEWKKDHYIGLQLFQYNRGERLGRLFANQLNKLSWADFNRFKFDKSYLKDGVYGKQFRALYELDEKKYPQLSDAIAKMKNWNLEGAANNRDAALAMVTHEYMTHKTGGPFAMLMIRKEPVSESLAVEALEHARKFLLKTHGTIDLPLGDVQRQIRGSVSLPASGLREVLRAAEPKLIDKKRGIYRITGGDGYIQMNRYSPTGVEIQSINAYGASAHPNSPHYTDQMEMFMNEQLKPMTLDREKILREAVTTYHPR